MKPCDCFMCNGFFLEDEESCDCEINKDASSFVDNDHKCKLKEYIGIYERYFYCEVCGDKTENK